MKIDKKDYVDYGCGFPVVISFVTGEIVRGEWTPDINYKKLHDVVAKLLANKQFRLTGNEIKFIRHYCGMQASSFASYLGVNWKDVKEWEKVGDGVPDVRWPIERDMRMNVLDKTLASNSEIGELYCRLRFECEKPTKVEMYKVFL